MNPWFLGIDVGTGSRKSVIIDKQAHILGFGDVVKGDNLVESVWTVAERIEAHSIT